MLRFWMVFQSTNMRTCFYNFKPRNVRYQAGKHLNSTYVRWLKKISQSGTIMEPSGYSWNRERFFQPLGNPFSRRHSQEKCSYCPQIISWKTGIFFNKFKEWSPPSLLHQLELASQVLHGPWKWWKSIGHFFDGCQEFLLCILSRYLWIWNWFWWISCRFRFLTCFSHPPLPGVEDPPPISLLSWVFVQPIVGQALFHG